MAPDLSDDDVKPMSSRRATARAMFENWFCGAAVVAVVGLATACEDGVVTPPDDESSVTVSNANPDDGNGSLVPDTMTIQHFTEQGIQDLDKVTLSAYNDGDSVVHEIEIYWLPATAEVRLCQHFWTPVGGATSGSTRCAQGTANGCDQATVSVDPNQETIIFNGMVLQDVFGGDATSTLNGIVRWEGEDDGSDH